MGVLLKCVASGAAFAPRDRLLLLSAGAAMPATDGPSPNPATSANPIKPNVLFGGRRYIIFDFIELRRARELLAQIVLFEVGVGVEFGVEMDGA